MRVTRAGVFLDVIDYEIVRLSTGDPPDEVGAFADAYVADGPPFRLVAGYLMLEERAPGRLGVFSHGRRVAEIAHKQGVLTCTPVEEAVSWRADNSVYRAAGVAVRAEGEHVIADAQVVSVTAAGALTVVHGPAADKVNARLALYDSLLRVGGRRG